MRGVISPPGYEESSTQTFTKTCTHSGTYVPVTVVKNPVTGSLGLPFISIAVGITVNENISHTLWLVQLNFVCFSALNIAKSQQVHSIES